MNKVNKKEEALVIYSDGACNNNLPPWERTATWGFVVKIGNDILCRDRGICHGSTSNEAEYWGIIRALEWLVESDVKEAVILSDSRLVVNQINGRWKCKAGNLRVLLNRTWKFRQAGDYQFQWIPREMNVDADWEAAKAGDEYAPLEEMNGSEEPFLCGKARAGEAVEGRFEIPREETQA